MQLAGWAMNGPTPLPVGGGDVASQATAYYVPYNTDYSAINSWPQDADRYMLVDSKNVNPAGLRPIV